MLPKISPGIYLCPICHSQFDHPMYVINHVVQNHTKFDLDVEQQLNPRARLGDYRCPTCAKHFDFKLDVRDHCWKKAHYVIQWVNATYRATAAEDW